jgi:hypothetical protein
MRKDQGASILGSSRIWRYELAKGEERGPVSWMNYVNWETVGRFRRMPTVIKGN